LVAEHIIAQKQAATAGVITNTAPKAKPPSAAKAAVPHPGLVQHQSH